MLDAAGRSVEKLTAKIEECVKHVISQSAVFAKLFGGFSRIKLTDASKLEEEYRKLVEGLQGAGDDDDEEDDFMANPGTHTHLCCYAPD